MMARMSGRPRSSTGTVPDHCELQATPTTRAGSTPEEARTRRVPRVIARVLDPRRAAWYSEQGLQTICPTQIAIEQLEKAALEIG